MIRTDKRLRLCAALLILNLAFIWGNSLMSAEASLAFSNWVKSLLDFLSGAPESGVEGSGLLRKAAHFGEFACLGMLLTWLAAMVGERGLHLFAMPLFLALKKKMNPIYIIVISAVAGIGAGYLGEYMGWL